MWFYRSQNDFEYSEGDRIVYFSHEDQPTGIIYTIDNVNNEVTVSWDKMDYIPQKQTFPKSFFTELNFRIFTSLPQGSARCTCGVDSVGEGLHSDYCDKYQK